MSKNFTVYDFVVADREMVAKGGGFSWRTYTDRVGKFGNAGAEVFFNDGTKDRSGRAIGKGFSVNQSHYKLQAREGQRDYDDKSLVDYFKFAPFCLGSPNGDYTDADGNELPLEEVQDFSKNLTRVKSGEIKQHNVKIKMLDDELDAKLALETGLKRAEAQISAGQIDEETLGQIAALIGVFDTAEKTMRLKVYEFAGKRPLDYFKHLESGDRAVRALIRKALADGILKEKGSVIFWEQTVIGNDENSAVATLLGDTKMMDALSQKVDFKIQKKKKK